MTGDCCSWLYAVAANGCDPSLLHGVRGVAGEHPHLVAAADLTAVVGAVPGTDFDAPALHRHLEDADWLERAVRAHHEVIGALARAAPTLPLRFATLYRDDRRVLRLLRDHDGELRAALAHIAGRTEWGVKAYLRALPTPGAASEAAGAGDTATARPGTAYLLRRRAARTSTARALDEAAEHARQVHRALARFAADAAEHPPQNPQASGVRDPMLLNGAYLVDRARADEFANLVAELSGAHGSALRLEPTGPWPPYSFARLDLPAPEEGP